MSTATVAERASSKQGGGALSFELDERRGSKTESLLTEKDSDVPENQQLSKADLFFILVVLSLIFVTQHFYNTTYL